MRNSELLPADANSAFRIPNSELKKTALSRLFLVAGMRIELMTSGL